jgi:hypothetical protein
MSSENRQLDRLIYKTTLLGIIGIAALLVLIYFVVFGRALSQSEQHVAIVMALPKVTLNSQAVPVDQQTYLSKGNDSFITEMEREGFTHVEQLGSVHIFTKDGKRYIADSRMYSSYFMLFSYPKES